MRTHGRPSRAHSRGRADDEEELPGERIEEPGLIGRIGVKRPAERSVEHVEQRRSNAGRSRANASSASRTSGKSEQHDVERQDVEKRRLEIEQERANDGDMRLAQKSPTPISSVYIGFCTAISV